MHFVRYGDVIIHLILVLIFSNEGDSMLDSRCYLNGGGSTENFNASEDLPVGSVIGQLSILGDPRTIDGNVTLDLRERNAAVIIKPGTKELILANRLDREGKNGLSSIYVNVICKRKFSVDTSFVIPVNVYVIDVNDNAPKWIGAPYHLTLSEVTVPGTRILQGARAIDDDAEGPFSQVEYHVIDGQYSDYVSFVSPSDGTLSLRKALDFERMKNFSVKLRAQDKGAPPKYSDTMLYVEVLDADDQNPKFKDDSYWGEIPLPGSSNRIQIQPEPIKAFDQDVGIRASIVYSLTSSKYSEHFQIDAQTAVITVKKSYYSARLDSVTLVVRATQADNPDRYSLATVSLTSRGILPKMNAEKLEVIPSRIKIRAREDTAIGSILLTLSINQSHRQPIRYEIDDNHEMEYFRINAHGEIILEKALDFEESSAHRFRVVAIDGVRNATADVEIEVIDVNEWEPRFRRQNYEFTLPKEFNASRAIALGLLEAADGDHNDKIKIELHGDLAEYFFIDQDRMLWITPDAPNVTVMHLLATVSDNGSPARSSTVPITITNNAIERIESSWAASVLKAFAFVFMLFVVIIVTTCIHLYRRNDRQSGDSRQSPSTLTLKSKYVKNDVAIDAPRNFIDLKSSSFQPVNSHLINVNKSDTIGSSSDVSVGASTIMAASLEREAQRDRELENYTATVRSIISRASAAGNIYDDDDFEHDSLSNCGSRKPEWKGMCNSETNVIPINSNRMGLNPQIVKVTCSDAVLNNTENAMYF